MNQNLQKVVHQFQSCVDTYGKEIFLRDPMIESAAYRVAGTFAKNHDEFLEAMRDIGFAGY